MTVDGELVTATVTRNENRILVSGGDVNVSLSAIDADGAQVSLDADGNLRVTDSDSLVVEATGFDAGDDIESWLFSDPRQLGTEKADSMGHINATYGVPAGLESGAHRMVLRSKSASGSETLVSVGLLAGSSDSGGASVSVIVGIVLALATIAALLVPVAIRRRRTAE